MWQGLMPVIPTSQALLLQGSAAMAHTADFPCGCMPYTSVATLSYFVALGPLGLCLNT